MKVALLAGGSGLVGHHLLNLLLQRPEYSEVHVFVRRPLPFSHPKLFQQVVEFGRLALARCPQGPIDDVYCCLGTTLRAAGSREAFRKVDLEYPMELARVAREHGVRRFLVISSIGADPGSRVFYSRTKGELEETLKESGIPEIHVVRPSLLVGDRRDRRAGERVALKLSPLLVPMLQGPLRKYRPIRAVDVAEAMIRLACAAGGPGFHIHESDELMRLLS